MYGSRSLCLSRRFLSFLPFLPPLLAFIWIFPAFRRECKFPTLGAWRASCSSWVISLSITRVILSDLVPTRSAYRAFINTLVLFTAVQDAVINACMYLLHI